MRCIEVCANVLGCVEARGNFCVSFSTFLSCHYISLLDVLRSESYKKSKVKVMEQMSDT